MVPNTRDDLPDPETPVNTVSRRLGISTLTSLRLFSRAPWTRIRSWLSAACCSMRARLSSVVGWGSVLGQGRERLLGVLVPAHAPERVLPAALHVPERRLVGGVAGGDHVTQVPVLGLDHVVGGRPGERQVAGTAELLAGHRLHDSSWIRTMLPAGSRTAQSRVPQGWSVGSWTTSTS